MYSFTALIARLVAAMQKKIEDMRAPKPKSECLFCVHHETALRRQPLYVCPRCKTVYERRK